MVDHRVLRADIEIVRIFEVGKGLFQLLAEFFVGKLERLSFHIQQDSGKVL